MPHAGVFVYIAKVYYMFVSAQYCQVRLLTATENVCKNVFYRSFNLLYIYHLVTSNDASIVKSSNEQIVTESFHWASPNRVENFSKLEWLVGRYFVGSSTIPCTILSQFAIGPVSTEQLRAGNFDWEKFLPPPTPSTRRVQDREIIENSPPAIYWRWRTHKEQPIPLNEISTDVPEIERTTSAGNVKWSLLKELLNGMEIQQNSLWYFNRIVLVTCHMVTAKQ